MGGHYEKDIMRQLQDVMARLDKTEQKVDDTKKAWKKEVKEINAKFAVERKKLKTEIKDLKTELKIVKTENTNLKSRVKSLENENSRLRSQQNNDSTNSSLPPSTDQKGSSSKKANEYNSRKKSGKNCGGQTGHKGQTLDIEKIKENIASGKLKHEIVDIGNTANAYETRYIVDYEVMPIAKEVRFHADDKGEIHIPKEYRMTVTYGEVIKAMAIQLYSEGVVSNERIQAFINAIGNDALNVSSGSIYNFVKSFANKCDKEIEAIKEELKRSEVLYTDATVVTVNGKQAYIRNQSTEKAVLYSDMDKKSIKSIQANSLLSEYKGILIHDHETSMYNFGTGHGECNVHLLRYLKKNTEDSNNKWSEQLSELLLDMNRVKKQKLSEHKWFDVSEIEAYEKKYDKIIKHGCKENKKTASQYAREEELTLLNRLAKYKENHLLFIHDSRVPFDNNMSERDLRKCKNRQKMAGGFRTYEGHKMYCRILSVIETCKRRGENIFKKIKSIITVKLVAA